MKPPEEGRVYYPPENPQHSEVAKQQIVAEAGSLGEP